MTEDNHDALIARTSAYALKAQQAFDNTMAEIMRMVRLSRLKPDFQNGQMYSFREEPALRQARVEQALRRLQSIVVTAAERGIALEWQRAEADMTELMNSVYGPDAAAAIRAEDKGRNERNSQARQAFIARSDRGTNLSSRVWQSCTQMRDQMEMAITVALGDGTSAQEASRDRLTSDPVTLKNVATRDIRKYLNDPDLCFRRFRYKDANGVWSRKWKKRIRDPRTGRVTWQDWDRDSYIPTGAGSSSRGVYKSAYKNAARVTRTETNMAYRNADYEQWLNNPNVLGIHIEPFKGTKKSRGKGGKQIKHIPDICDRLAGDYPKTFRFEGWHPQCYCTVTPILISKAESDRRLEAALRGEPFTPTEQPIRDYPDNFKRFVADNADRIQKARHAGTEPYFTAHNREAIDRMMQTEDKADTTAQKAAAAIAGIIKKGRAETKRVQAQLADNSYRFEPNEAQRAQAAEIERLTGARQGEPMDIATADSGNANPRGHKDSCQTSSVTTVARLQGFDAEAKAYVENKEAISYKVGADITKAFLTLSGKPIAPLKEIPIHGLSQQSFEKLINNLTREKGIYMLGLNNKKNGHQVVAIRTKKGGKLIICDPSFSHADYISTSEILEQWESIDILRVDNKLFNLDMVKGLFVASK